LADRGEQAGHGSQDLLITSGQIGVDPETSPLSLLVVPVMIGLAVLLWRRRHRIEPEPASATEPAAGPDPGAVTQPAADAARP
jgi:hypothetical protein